MESRKELEDERRAQIWLREKVGQLEKDLLLQMQVHQENMETMQASLKHTEQVLMTPQPTQNCHHPRPGTRVQTQSNSSLAGGNQQLSETGWTS